MLKKEGLNNMAKPLEFIQPKNKNAKQVDWKISERTRALVSYYAEYSEYTEEEVVDTFLQLNLIKDEQFIEWIKSKRHNKRMLKAIGIDDVQYNDCTNPFCESFGLPQERFTTVKNKPYRYKLHGSKKGTKSIFFNSIPIPTKIPKTSLGCSTYTLSNWSVAEEIKRLIELQTVEEIYGKIENSPLLRGNYPTR